MAEGELNFSYVAMAPSGRRVSGAVVAADQASAYAQLKRSGLSPVRIVIQRRTPSEGPVRLKLSDRQLADLLSDLAALLHAGSDVRTALSVLAQRSNRTPLRDFCKRVSSDISGGEAVDAAFARPLPARFAFVGALIAAGEASGDLSAGLGRAAEMLNARIRLREQLVSSLSYPAFVLISTIGALLVILLFLVPSLAPLADSLGSQPPITLSVLLAMSDLLRENLGFIGGVVITGAIALPLAAKVGLLSKAADRILLDGPFRRTASAIVYGGFAIALGDMLVAGTPMSQALRLAARSVRSELGRKRLQPVTVQVREGEALSAALERVPGFPAAVVRLAGVGELSGALGAMLARAGRLEEHTALRRIEGVGRLLGPVMIVVLGGLIGLLMAGLLSSVQQVGDVALQ